MYGSLRPDDDNSGKSWTKSAVAGLKHQKAKLLNAKLYQEEYACAVLLDSSLSPEISSGGSGSDNNSVMGYVLSTNDDELFKEKLQLFDQIEGYTGSSSSNLYDRTVRDVELIPPKTDCSNNNNSMESTTESVKVICIPSY